MKISYKSLIIIVMCVFILIFQNEIVFASSDKKCIVNFYEFSKNLLKTKQNIMKYISYPLIYNHIDLESDVSPLKISENIKNKSDFISKKIPIIDLLKIDKKINIKYTYVKSIGHLMFYGSNNGFNIKYKFIIKNNCWVVYEVDDMST